MQEYNSCTNHSLLSIVRSLVAHLQFLEAYQQLSNPARFPAEKFRSVLSNRHQKEVVELYFQKWEKLSQQIHEAHNLRNGEAENLMRNGITLFEELVLSSSLVDQSSMFDTNEQYEVLPINGMERYLFVRMRPGLSRSK